MTDTIKIPMLTREAEALDLEIRKQDSGQTRITFSASSTHPVERVFGNEILDHSPKAIRMDRAKRGAMPLLFNHDMGDPIGMIDAASIDSGRFLVDAHFFDTDRAKEVERMVSGGLRNVSIGYRIHRIEETDADTYTVREWEPFEASIVTVPADPTVGIGRAVGEEFDAVITRSSTPTASNAKGNTMSDKDTAPAAANAEPKIEITREPSPSALELEKNRKRAIENLCKANKLDDKYRDMWIGQGVPVEDVSEDILRILEERGKANPQPATRLGMTDNEAQKFSFVRAIRAIADKDWKNAGFELECSRSVAQKLGRSPDPHKFYVPFEVMQRPTEGRRDLTVATAGAAGYLVGTENQGFIEMVRNRSVAFRMGARRLSGLQGSVTIPRQSAAATAYWLANESTAITESQQTFVQVALIPKNVGAYTEISRQLLLQSSPGAEGIVTDDLAQVVALAADLAVLEGSGAAGQPTGIANTAGIGSVTGTSLAAAGVLEFQTDVAGSNVTPMSPGYVTTPAVAGLLMVRPELPTTGTTRLWTGNIWDGAMFGMPAMTSNQLTAASMIFGDWSEVVVGEWGVLEVEVNPYANFQAGIIGVRAIYSMDVGVRRPFAFSRATTIT